ncbi:hypothetical protein CAPTEDRAFT_189758 [Capitella teleta]|uniref:Uncharacterized protein n=1 Tax=Capitella teleta TaxID=283909 RepID=R7U2M6_CAPTE|nr:hypothetical protein CAPTEDRAFT_189758 [Capitella teleta]|eukprot:ELU00133.1 hypothetical protein CAPTEDRAFT_189758 [Capitella teleta]
MACRDWSRSPGEAIDFSQSEQTKNRTHKKTKEANQDVYQALLAYRNTPLTASSKSLAQLLMGCHLNEPLFAHPSSLNKDDCDADVDVEAKLKSRELQEANFNRQCRPLTELLVGTPMRIQDQANKDWGTKAVVTDHVGPCSYQLKTYDGSLLRRNRLQIKASAECDAPAEADAQPAINPSAIDQPLQPSATAVDPPPPPRRSTRVTREPQRLEYL